MALEKLIKNLILGAGLAGGVYLFGCGRQPDVNVYMQSPQQQAQIYECSDGIDNDGDTLIDNLDPGCYNNGIYFPTKTSEINEPVVNYQCSDGIDNDGDTLVDYEDIGCYTDNLYNPNDNDETNVINPKNIVINEFEQNPVIGSEWVELYNTNSVSIDISGWKIYDMLSSPKLIHTVPGSTTLALGEYYSIDVINLNNAGDGLSLYDSLDNLIDQTPILVESTSSNNCWARVPNGSDTDELTDWTFQTCTQGSTNNTPPAPKIEKITFVSSRDGNDEIYVMNADGTNQTRLTNNPANDKDPVWSPDGNYITFASNRDGDFEIYTINIDGTDIIQLTNNITDDWSPAWSPDGTKIAFSRGAIGSRDIYTMNPNGTGQIKITTNSQDEEGPAWSPDGTKIAFTRCTPCEIMTMNPNGSNETNLSNNPNHDISPSWSPDGNYIAFFSSRDSGIGADYQLYIMNADGTAQTRITTNPAFNGSPAWSPDGTKIIFNSDRDGDQEIYVMDPDGLESNLVNLTNNSSQDSIPKWIYQNPISIDIHTIGLWHMDEPSWNGTLDEVVDSSIYGNHGTAYGNATTISDGKINNAGTFDGTGDYIQIPHNDLMNTPNITVEAYIYLNNLNKSQRIVDRYYYPGGRMWSFSINPSNQLTLNISSDCSSGSLEFSTPTTLNANQWYHVAFTYDGSNARILQDGNVVLTQPYIDGICTTGTSPITIGAYFSGGESFFDGKIDEVIISDIVKY